MAAAPTAPMGRLVRRCARPAAAAAAAAAAGCISRCAGKTAVDASPRMCACHWRWAPCLPLSHSALYKRPPSPTLRGFGAGLNEREHVMFQTSARESVLMRAGATTSLQLVVHVQNSDLVAG
eukprot:CAMPEP_0175175596 /NCGR_PEP_ID=MMETSP0087-20121206/33294_1 /TAXON_ID=136419 /ORGANISM="Unknown Unknown, Strain D1" /LENGTH=121 /DNA_ID=CAMNT_0016467231 /DNA_START=730 /DNA_END=1091 /DNA_ORIENTATION=+